MSCDYMFRPAGPWRKLRGASLYPMLREQVLNNNYTVPKIRLMSSQKLNCAGSFLICERFINCQERSANLAADTWMWKLEDRTLQFCFGNKEAAQFHFWETINRNQTFILDSHRTFIYSALFRWCYKSAKSVLRARLIKLSKTKNPYKKRTRYWVKGPVSGEQ